MYSFFVKKSKIFKKMATIYKGERGGGDKGGGGVGWGAPPRVVGGETLGIV